MPDEDAAIIDLFHETQPVKVHLKHARMLSQEIAWRLYTEFCLNNDWKKHGDYNGETWKEWIADEVHYAWERRQASGENTSGEISTKIYREMRQKVIEAAAKRGIELFGTWGSTMPPYQYEDDPGTGKRTTKHLDSRNLRASLEPYLQAS